MYCADDRCSLPLHTLITDIVDSQGGSALWIKILNRLGVCTSLDTLSHFVQYKSTSLDTYDHLNTDSCTLVSADNIDFIYAQFC